MADIREFKRMNYFTGFFTTADDWRAEQAYHREKLKLHNRGLHTVGVMAGVREELAVRAIGGLAIEVRPGAAVDGEGEEILLGEPRTVTIQPERFTLPRPVYVTVVCRAEETDRAENVQVPAYSGYTRITETAFLEVTDELPDNVRVIELARIDLQPGVTAIADPADPDNPGANAVDRRRVPFAAARCEPDAAASLPEPVRERLAQLMSRTRRDYAALAGRFPTPSCEDVRQGAMTLEMLARGGCLRPEHLAGLVAVLAAAEQDTGQELGAAFPPLARLQPYQIYLDAVERLLADLRAGDQGRFLTSQDQVAAAARELAEVVLEPPAATAGADMAVTATGDETVVTLDGSASRAFGGRTIARYHWELRESAAAPRADAGPDLAVTTAGEVATVALDASGSRAFGGQRIVHYRWNER